MAPTLSFHKWENKSGNVLTIICGLVSAAGIIYLLFTKKKKNTKIEVVIAAVLMGCFL